MRGEKNGMKKPNLDTIIIILALVALVFCVIIKFYVIYEYADTPIAEVPAWAWWWLGGR